MKFLNVFISAILLSAIAISCSSDSTSPEPTPIDYENITTIEYSTHVQPLLNEYRTILNTNNILPAGLDMTSWDELIKGWERGEVVIPFDADNSLLVELTTKLSSTTELDSVKTAFLTRWINEGAKNDAGEVPYAGSTNRLYVCNQNAGSVSIIDTDAKVVIRNINFTALGFSTTPKPHDLAVEPDGSAWYVSLIGDGKVLKFNSDNNLVGQADFIAAGLLALNPSKDLLYVGHTLSVPNVPSTNAVITRSTMALTEISVPFARPHGLVSDKAGRYTYSASLVDYAIGVFDSDTDPASGSAFAFPPGTNRTIVQINVSPNDQRMIASSQQTSELMVFDISDPANIAVVDSFNTGGMAPWHPKYNTAGDKIYVGNNGSHQIAVMDANSGNVQATIGVGDGSDGLAQPHGLVVSPSDNFVYVSNRNVAELYTPVYQFEGGANSNHGTVAVINTATNTLEKVIEIGPFPSGIAIYEE
ncbi:MAG: YncE family protein [Calditrichota bacterium]